VAGQVDEVIWQTASLSDGTSMVTVRRAALAVILPIVDIGLAHSGADILADLEEAMAHLRAALLDGLAGSDPNAASDNN
jgi:hypothetical protein